MRPPKPALLGGPPVRPQGPPPWPIPDPDVWAALEKAYSDGAWGKYHGPGVPHLEAALKEYHQAEHLILCGSGTYAVELGLRALQVGPGDEVLLAAYDYPGNFFAVHAIGATPVLVDIEPRTWQMDFDSLQGAIGPVCKAIVVSHLHGGNVPMNRLMDLARQHHLKVVEDAAQCPGAIIEGRKAATWGDVGVLSFGGSKLLSAGRGGALICAEAQTFQRAKTHHLRGNIVCPLSELQAAVLVPQLAKLDERNAERAERVTQLRSELHPFPALRLFEATEKVSGYYKVGMQYDADAFGLSRELLVKAMRAEGIPLDEGFAGLHVGRSTRRYRAADNLREATRAHHQCVVLHHPILLNGPTGIAEFMEALTKVHAWREDLRFV